MGSSRFYPMGDEVICELSETPDPPDLVQPKDEIMVDRGFSIGKDLKRK